MLNVLNDNLEYYIPWKKKKGKKVTDQKKKISRRSDTRVRWKRKRENWFMEVVVVMEERKGLHGWKIYKRLEEIWVDADGKSEEN